MFSPNTRTILSGFLVSTLLTAPIGAAPPTLGQPGRQPTPSFKVVPLPKATPSVITPVQPQGTPRGRSVPRMTLPKTPLPKVTLPSTLARQPLTAPGTSSNVGAQAPRVIGGQGVVINAIPRVPRDVPQGPRDQARHALEERERIGYVSNIFRPQDADWGGPLPWNWGQADPGAPADPAPHPDANVDAGPTAWDWVAIGLSAAALARANQGGGGSVGYPIVCPTPSVVEQFVAETPSPAGEPRAVGIPSIDTEAVDADLPRIEVGKSFELPGNGLGDKPGRVALKIGSVFVECRVETWSTTGLKASVPRVVLDGPAAAEIIVAQANGALLAQLDAVVEPIARRAP